MATAEILVAQDLINRIGETRLIQYFDDGGNHDLAEEDAQLQSTMAAAEGLVFSRMLRGGYDKAAVIALVDADETSKEMLAWVACELGSERRPEFTTAEGWGAHRVQYERAMQHFDLLAKGRIRSQGEAVAGRNAHVGGRVQPSPPKGTPADFTFAPSKNAPTGRGGF